MKTLKNKASREGITVKFSPDILIYNVETLNESIKQKIEKMF